ncbi:MAG: transcriptional regulator [bacterium]|nr:transcriptional regulator [bacterium]
MDKSIEALFGSKTRVKLLNLFLNNPEKTFYVREITRLIDEQVNSVRRELKNLEDIKAVNSATEDRKLFYGINQRFKYYIPLRAIFAGIDSGEESIIKEKEQGWRYGTSDIDKDLGILIISGVLVKGSESDIDMILVGNNSKKQLSDWAKNIEKQEGRDLNYVILSMEEFYYRYTSSDVFINGIFQNEHRIIVDREDILKNKERR